MRAVTMRGPRIGRRVGHWLLVLAAIAMLASCDNDRTGPETGVPPEVTTYAGTAAYIGGFAGPDLRVEMSLEIDVEHSGEAFSGTWTETLEDVVHARRFSGTLDSVTRIARFAFDGDDSYHLVGRFDDSGTGPLVFEGTGTPPPCCDFADLEFWTEAQHP